MRTFLQQLAELVRKDRAYAVAGVISFVYSQYDQPDLAQLRQAIMDVDSRFPWSDEPRPDETFQSIGHLSDGESALAGWGAVDDMICWFHIHPMRDYVRKGQIYAYEKYLERLISELAAMGIPNVKSVRCTIETHSTIIFDSPLQK
jgi:hypothetical protein